jgi:AAA domain
VSAAPDVPNGVHVVNERTGEQSEIYTKSEVLRILTNAVDARSAREAMQRDRELGYVLTPAAELLDVRTPPEYTVAELIERGTSVGLVGAPESGKSLLDAHLLACVGTGQHFHGRPCRLGLAVWLCGEGLRGIARRLQALEQHYKLPLRDAALVISKAPASLINPVEVLAVRAAIERAEDRFGVGLELLVVDTVSRFLVPGDESKAQDMGAFLDAVDQLRGDAAAICNHHPGHGDARRARGSSNWRGALDAEYTIEAAGELVTLTCIKMKDGEKPGPLNFRLQTAPTRFAREDGTPVQSVVLVPTDAVATRPALTGKNQIRLASALADYRRTSKVELIASVDLRSLARGVDIDRRRFMEAVNGLEQFGYLIPAVGGWRIAHDL